MIKNFADKETEKIYTGKFSKKLPENIQKRALIKLMMMESSMNINDLRVPPSNHLEKLVGNREGQYSIAINDQYRICFTLEDVNNFCDVEIVDYH
ncbi:type II toxin-antitoxin system RelE/ParE family toxin [Liquorilactobacillus hordei]|uniref:Plasmid maintenance system killer protein n=1 Tax=Liquorilactobacillus hordei DSM 19519 TaxID=1423759 RepID=A0A0R1M707_9LACO|nr:type II toxin-antitoxin system RelE/ParE family toxin [Liquorilactobacillus hordei]KRL03886.1 plasmid maintenance system killer protein [Liquorilactobacillus hordei DSM 19519]QYH51424.1 type II toxin-antitoxin system RelE/ParE family toxin [Liquorilactobacillus hordei DSM 19519]